MVIMDPKISITLLKGGDIYAPEHLGVKNLLISGSQIIGILPENVNRIAGFDFDIIDLSGLIITSGFIDLHCHLTGGGGENGPSSRTPAAKLSELIESGITTTVGILGTDSITRSLENLLAKVRALSFDGLSAWMYTGSYHVPPITLTGSISRDLVLIEQIIGVGEIAISDHRGSHPSFRELSSLASQTRLGGMLGGKPGIIHCHMGGANSKLDPLWEVVKNTPIPIQQFLLTHITRTNELKQEGKKWLKEGGWIDFTADIKEDETANTLIEFSNEQLPIERVTVSTDAYGSLPSFDSQGNFLKIEVAMPMTLLQVIRSLYFSHQLELNQILPFFTINPAKRLGLTRKGALNTGNDADLLIFNQNLELQYVYSNGIMLKSPTFTKKGQFE